MPTTTTAAYRVNSIDILRGIVMIIMALDHTRDFFHVTAMTADPLNPATTTPALFFTRWITHFCAPTFVLLSGVSAYLSSRSKTKAEASTFLLKRGLWLVLVEITLVTLGITFDPFYSFIILQVIWAIGWSMVILGLLVRASYYVIFVTGVILFFGHNILDYLQLPASGITGNLWSILLTARGTVIPLDSNHFIGVFYAILPWTGIMLMGYSMGAWFHKDFSAEKRKKFLLASGLSLILLFIVLRMLKGYGDPGAWDGDSVFSFLNTSKYPPSLQYSSMTLGPALLALALTENIKASWSKVVSVYGKVPFFYYILHFYLIHTLLVIVFFATGHTTSQIVDTQSLFLFRPQTFGFNLWIVYGIWIFVVAVLYLPCKWYSNYKAQHRRWWLSYV
ncbi:DUF1624 domain-containing protein [Terrimonas alba]|uniref:DUF1624 domain-containing protein n=1 Tax=Terrimonas alba TaxID=3349636 RepID=UPI0035F3CF74